MALEHTTWRLEEEENTTGQSMPTDATEHAITLSFEPGENDTLRVAGKGGCNRYTASCMVAGDTLTIGPIASTRMLCPEGIMEREARYFQLLASAQRYEEQNARLLIFCPPGELRFTRLNE
ncbi:MAG TPA: META domain-containing protein [Ktedonobacterales bacterium]|nr:META domain-containing protein [Ktedonobacterales bacterium]